LAGSEEFLAIGSDDVLGDEGVSIIEWADRVPGAMPENRLKIEITITGPESRTLALRPHGKRYEEILSHLA
ncbi:MAG: tRNA (adenosine(37)-N6)-threonylcarbamoyltransferase complex ATPase subunit type 1 TsaE, partial [Phycisphaerae bacterium]|nr:tRNA (adenosine(37)-N6)-threonylcarbamoyltransferase complex ATPase subunit type 1 TsaE [Phycisphaerae bacterium]